MTTVFAHKPVMLNECMEGLQVKAGGVYYDGTVGGGGHSNAILELSAPTGRLIATDVDEEAVRASRLQLDRFAGRYEIYHTNYKNFEQVFAQAGVDKVDGILLDFGVSSHQLDKEMRGFSYMKPQAPLDMRMDTKAYLTAELVVNCYPEDKLFRIIRDYGEERFAARIAENIVKARNKKRLTLCGELVEIIERSIPKKYQLGAPCARKTFQAIRIEVNGELDGLYDCVIGLSRRLKQGGRIAILTFHSLEDRIVKNAFRDLEQDCTCDKSLPVCVCGKVKEMEVITKKPIVPSAEEMELNSRSRSAKLRIAERVL